MGHCSYFLHIFTLPLLKGMHFYGYAFTLTNQKEHKNMTLCCAVPKLNKPDLQ